MLSLTVITLTAIRTLIISDNGPAAVKASVLADSSWGVNIVKTEIWRDLLFFFPPPQRDAILDIPIFTRGAAVFSGIKELKGKDGEKGKEILPFENWAMLSSVFDRKGQGDERWRLEGTFGSSDLRGSKPRPFAFVSRHGFLLSSDKAV